MRWSGESIRRAGCWFRAANQRLCFLRFVLRNASLGSRKRLCKNHWRKSGEAPTPGWWVITTAGSSALFCAPRDVNFSFQQWSRIEEPVQTESRSTLAVSAGRLGYATTFLRVTDKWNYIRENPVRKGLVAKPMIGRFGECSTFYLGDVHMVEIHSPQGEPRLVLDQLVLDGVNPSLPIDPMLAWTIYISFLGALVLMPFRKPKRSGALGRVGHGGWWRA